MKGRGLTEGGRGEGSCGFATALNLKGAVLSPQKGP